MKKKPDPLLHELIRNNIETYIGDLQGEKPTNLYGLTLSRVEKPLFEVVLYIQTETYRRLPMFLV